MGARGKEAAGRKRFEFNELQLIVRGEKILRDFDGSSDVNICWAQSSK